MFGAILTGRDGAGKIGADLQGWEVKSVKEGGSYEYQHHLNTATLKLYEDCQVNHLFCTYSKTYKNVEVRVLAGKDLAEKYLRYGKLNTVIITMLQYLQIVGGRDLEEVSL